MTIAERVAWALWVSETWYSAWHSRKYYIGSVTKSHSVLAFKARGIVVFDRVLNGRNY